MWNNNHIASSTHFVACDGNGNVTALVDSTTATVDARYDYDAFDKMTVVEGDAVAASNSFRFSTKYEDAETGLYYYGYRYYDPVTGRWINRHPIGERGGVNLYGFVGNDPIGKLDILGLREFCCGGRKYQTGGRAGIKGCCGGKVYGKGQQCCGGTITGRLKDRCCVNGQVKNRIPRHEKLGLSLSECVGRFTLHPMIRSV